MAKATTSTVVELKAALAKLPTTFGVILPEGKRPGLRACGDLLVGRAYDVSAEDAARLVSLKGFEFTSAAAERDCTARLAAQEQLATAEAEATQAAAAAQEG